MTRPPLPTSENRAYTMGETGKIRWEVLEYCNGSGLDLGCGSFKIHRNAIGIDGLPEWNGHPSQMNIASNVQTLDIFADRQFDFVYSSHCLEDLPDPKKALREWWRVLKPGGYLILYLPHPELYAAAMEGDKNGPNQHHKVVVTPEVLDDWMAGAPGGWDCLRSETRGERDEYSFLRVYRKGGKKKVNSFQKPRPEKTCAVVRYGGQGDHVMTRAILPVLKAEGYHITYVTNPAGKAFLEADPCIDAFITDTAGLNDGELLQFWHSLSTSGRFDRFINAMNSVENVCLPQPTQANHRLSKTLRDALFDLNYMTTTFAQAEVPMPEKPEAVWYPPERLAKWAREERRKLNGANVVVIALAGSAPHKVHPRWPKVVSLILEQDPRAVVVTIGGSKEAVLYSDFPETDRHQRMAGVWGINDAYAFAQVADVVVGPETGVMNATGQEAVAKVVLLSHSSEDQLCRYWTNYTALRQPDGEGCPLQPCHLLHWTFDTCQRDEATGGAKCASAIEPEEIAAAVLAYTKAITREKAA